METVLYVLGIAHYAVALISLISEKREARREKERDRA